jgi:hypothetical protein
VTIAQTGSTPKVIPAMSGTVGATMPTESALTNAGASQVHTGDRLHGSPCPSSSSCSPAAPQESSSGAASPCRHESARSFDEGPQTHTGVPTESQRTSRRRPMTGRFLTNPGPRGRSSPIRPSEAARGQCPPALPGFASFNDFTSVMMSCGVILCAPAFSIFSKCAISASSPG